MNLGILIFGELPAAMEARLLKSSRVLEFPLLRIRAQNIQVKQPRDIHILCSWGQKLEDLIQISKSIKTQIGDTPLLWLNELCLDSVTREKIPVSDVDGFLDF